MVDANQSAASAAGVTPPVTKWKNLGPAEVWAPSSPPTSCSRAAGLPTPSSGRAPPKLRAVESAVAERTGRSSTERR